jgi:hypothetical protein
MIPRAAHLSLAGTIAFAAAATIAESALAQRREQ